MCPPRAHMYPFWHTQDIQYPQLSAQSAQAYFQYLCQPLPAIHPSKSELQHAHSLYLRGSQEAAVCWWVCMELGHASWAVHLHVPKASQVQDRATSRKKRKLTIKVRGELPIHHLILTRNFKEYKNSKYRSILPGHFEGIFLKVER